MQIVTLREMLEMANLPSPALNAAADAGGVSYKTARNAQRVHDEDPELAKHVRDGTLSVNAATQILGMAPGPEQDEVRKAIATTKNKKAAKAIVGQKKKKQSKRFGTLEMPGLTGEFNTLLKVLENIPKLPSELRNLKHSPHRLSAEMGRTFKRALDGLANIDFADLVAAIDEAHKELDGIIDRSSKGAVSA